MKIRQIEEKLHKEISIIILVSLGKVDDSPVYLVDQWSIAHLEGICMQMNGVSDNFWYWPFLLNNFSKMR